jgi:hypothetical protein
MAASKIGTKRLETSLAMTPVVSDDQSRWCFVPQVVGGQRGRCGSKMPAGATPTSRRTAAVDCLFDQCSSPCDESPRAGRRDAVVENVVASALKLVEIDSDSLLVNVASASRIPTPAKSPSSTRSA